MRSDIKVQALSKYWMWPVAAQSCCIAKGRGAVKTQVADVQVFSLLYLQIVFI